MSEQQGGILEMAQSYHYNRNENTNYRSRSIDPASFYQWHKDNMYKSTYAQFHSRVYFLLARTLSNLKVLQFLGTLATFQESRLTIFMLRAFRTWLNNPLVLINLVKICLDLPPLALTYLKMCLLIIRNLVQPVNMVKVPYKDLTLTGM